MKRIGIYAGTFNPVHAGHIAFALQAKEAAQLDQIYFMPERKPRHKTGVEHYGHRVAMIRAALQPHEAFRVLELPDISFTVAKTLPALQHLFADAQLVFLFGSDVVPSLEQWLHIDKLFAISELVIGFRENVTDMEMKTCVEGWPTQPRAVTLFPSYAANVSSTQIRNALLAGQATPGLLKSVQRYSNHHWLYVSLGKSN